METQRIIADVDGPTDWVHNLVATEKNNGEMRLCLDPRPLNKAVRREYYRIPTSENAQTHLSGEKLFTVVDMRDAFWHVKLSEKSSYLCTFNTPWGRKHFLRMPFGISSAIKVLQQRNDDTFGDISNVHIVADDLIIAGRDEREHDEALNRVLDRATTRNVKFSPHKLQYKVKQVKYMGHILSEDGQRPNPAKVEAISSKPRPADQKGTRRLLGMIKYLEPYIPGKYDITAPLRNLLNESTEWQWTEHHDQEWEKTKSSAY